MAAQAPRVSLEFLQESRAEVMKNLNLIALLPVLESREIFLPNELRILKDEGHSQIERISYLLQGIYKRGQSGVDIFLQCLRDEVGHPGHQEILHLLEKSAPDQLQQNRILEILDDQLEAVASYLNLTAFLNILTKSGMIPVPVYMDVTNPYRTQRENVTRFIRVIQNQGVQGLIDLIKSLQQDTATSAHQKLAKLLLDEVKKFLKTSPHKGQVSPADKIALLQLDTSRELGAGAMQMSLEQDFKRHEAKLIEGINFQVLLPYLQKRSVLTSAEADTLKSYETASERNRLLLSLVIPKGQGTLRGLLDCFKESSKHKELAKLFEKPALSTTSQPKKPVEKTEKLAVMICMDKYVELDAQYMPVTINMSKYNEPFEEHRERLKTCLERLSFKVVRFGDILAHMDEEDEEEEGVKDSSARIRDLFQKYVVSYCSKDATVFIYISGIQFPFKLTKDKGPMRHDAYSGAVLLQGRLETSREQSDCLRAQDLYHWVEMLPTDYVTFLIDCHQSHVVAYGKLKQPKEVEIMGNAWRHLTSLHSSTVVYFVKPDPEAMGRQRDQDWSKKSVFGLVTDKFTQVLMSWIRRNRPEVVSHRLFYEALSFHWHKHGREHLLFSPAVQGDVDRAFLGKSTYPYHQVFRADLSKTPSSETFNLNEMLVATGTMAGIILGDELEVSHILRPEVKVGGKITKATSLSAIAEVRDRDREKFASVLLDIYEEGNRSRDGSTESVLVKKKFPLHQREQYAVFVEQNVGESGAETIKQYIRESSMLLALALKEENAKMVVRMDGQFYLVDDLANDVAAKVKVRRIQQVKSMLEMIAWLKYVKRLKQPQKAAHLHTCHMTLEKPLLKKSIPLSLEFQMKCTTHIAQYSPKEAILDFSDQQKFWIPDRQDTHPVLEVEFRNNYIVTGMEIRGDAQEEKYVTQAMVEYQKLVPAADKKVVYEGPTKDQSTKSINLHCQEPVRYVTIIPESWVQKEGFNVTLKMKHKKGTTLYDVEGMTILSWEYHQRRGTGWKFIPTPDPNGYINLGDDYHWLSWTGNSPDPVTFDLATGFLLDRIDVAAITDTGHLQRFQLHLHTQWLEKNFPTISSVWPMKYQFPQPFLASNVRLRPLASKIEPRVQLQLYGNKHDEGLVVEERELVTLHFINTSQSQLFVYLFCLEETGMIQLVFMDVVKKVDGGQTKGMEPQSFKKMIRTNIPEDYDPPSKQITDTYKVFVSPKKMYLEPFIQRGLTKYHHTCCYNVCSLGRRSDSGRDEWYDYQFSVVVKAASSPRH